MEEMKQEQERRRGGEEERRRGAAVKFSGETLAGPAAPANNIYHHLSVRETALNRSPPPPTHTRRVI